MATDEDEREPEMRRRSWLGSELTWTGDVRAGGYWLRLLRERQGLSQREVSRRTGEEVSNVSLSSLELGQIDKPTLAMLALVGKALGVTPNQIADAYKMPRWHDAGEVGAEREPEEITQLRGTLSRLDVGARWRLLQQVKIAAEVADREQRRDAGDE